VGCIVLGRGDDDRKLRDWLATASTAPEYIGFAVGRTTVWDALTEWRAGCTSREVAATSIARRFREWVDIFAKAGPSRPDAVTTGRPAPR
jgi:5-dehydro-2-deoxygluconokinase